MSFALHPLMYFAILSFVFFPPVKTAKHSARDSRLFSYQILFHFGAFETFYLRLKDAEEEENPAIAGSYANP